MSMLRKSYVPTSVELQYRSLKKLLSNFCGSNIAFKSTPTASGELNFIEICTRKSRQEAATATARPQAHDDKTLVLMHGYGAGIVLHIYWYHALLWCHVSTLILLADTVIRCYSMVRCIGSSLIRASCAITVYLCISARRQ